MDMEERKSAFILRDERYLQLGYDRRAAVEYFIQAAGPLWGPALDIGTGKGFMAVALARKGMEVVTVDPEKDEQAFAGFLAAESGVAERISFVCGSADSLDYPDDYFGCAAMSDVLHHLDEPSPILEEVARVLKPSGKLILADFSEEGFELVSRVHREEGRDHPVSEATLESAEKVLSDAGLAVIARHTGHLHNMVLLAKGIIPIQR